MFIAAAASAKGSQSSIKEHMKLYKQFLPNALRVRAVAKSWNSLTSRGDLRKGEKGSVYWRSTRTEFRLVGDRARERFGEKLLL